MTPVCSKVADAPRPTDPDAFGEWIRHRNRPVHESGLCYTCYRINKKLERRNARARRVQKRYGLTEEQHDALYARQGGRCPHGRKITLLSPVDHDHGTGAVRGLMCDPCNRFLGYVGDSPQAFLNLWAYASRPPAQFDLITGHAFQTSPGLFQCTVIAELPWVCCGRLEHEHG
jgi:hypothetical protein